MNKKMAIALGKSIKTFRLGKRLTQEQLVNKIVKSMTKYSNSSSKKFTQGHLSRIESGQYFPSNHLLQFIIGALDCTGSELWATAELFDEKFKGSNTFSDFDCLAHPTFDLNLDAIEVMKNNPLFCQKTLQNILVFGQSLANEVKSDENREFLIELKSNVSGVDLTNAINSRALASFLFSLLESAVSEKKSPSSLVATKVPRGR